MKKGFKSLTGCKHKHKQVLGHILCVCCSHCQEENRRYKSAIKKLLALNGKNVLNHIEDINEALHELRLTYEGKK